MSNTNEREDLIAGLREHATFMCIEGAEKQRTLKAADMLENDLQDFETYSKIIKSATTRERHTRETLRKLLANMQAQQVSVPTWKAEQLDEYEIRVTSPEGESWRLRSVDRNDIFNNFIWRWAQSMIKGGKE